MRSAKEISLRVQLRKELTAGPPDSIQVTGSVYFAGGHQTEVLLRGRHQPLVPLHGVENHFQSSTSPGHSWGTPLPLAAMQRSSQQRH